MSPAPSPADQLLARIVRAYEEPLARAYCLVRFMIIRRRFLEQIGRHLPASGTVLDVGCGFGLFALYFASQIPGVEIRGFDLSARRITSARRAAARLGLRNVRFEVADAAGMNGRQASAVYMVDLMHHVQAQSVAGLLGTIASSLVPNGRLVIKDIEPTPRSQARIHLAARQARGLPGARALLGTSRRADDAGVARVPGTSTTHGRLPALSAHPLRWHEAAGGVTTFAFDSRRTRARRCSRR